LYKKRYIKPKGLTTPELILFSGAILVIFLAIIKMKYGG
jgi:hypothetical protein